MSMKDVAVSKLKDVLPSFVGDSLDDFLDSRTSGQRLKTSLGFKGLGTFCTTQNTNVPHKFTLTFTVYL